MNNKSQNTRWIILSATTSISFISGILYAWSVLGKELIATGWTGKQASLPYTVATVAYVIAMLAFGKVQYLKGPRICTVISGFLMGGGLILSGFFANAVVIAVTFGAITGAGIGISGVSMIPTAMKWFGPKKKGLINGIVVGGIGIAPVFFSPVSNLLIKYTGISNTFIVLGLFAWAVVLPLSRLITNPPEGYQPNGPTESTASPTGPISTEVSPPAGDMTRLQMLKTASFYKFWIMLAFSTSAGMMIISHAANMARVQAGWEGGYLLVILIAIFNASGRLLGGFVSDKIGRINLMRIIFLIQAVNMFLFSKYNTTALLAVGIVIAGMGYGATFAVVGPTVSELYGMKHFGANYSTLFTAWGVAGVIGPMTAAGILDSTNRYNGAYLIAGCLLIISLLISFYFSTPARADRKTAGKDPSLSARKAFEKPA